MMSTSNDQSVQPAMSNMLPAELAMQSKWFNRARNYPIFSGMWYRYRSLSFIVGIGLLTFVFFTVTCISQFSSGYASSEEAIDLLLFIFLLCAPLLLMCLLGPGAAVFIRSKNFNNVIERVSITGVLLIGIFISILSYPLSVSLYERQTTNDVGEIIQRKFPKFNFKVHHTTIKISNSKDTNDLGENAAERALQELIRSGKKVGQNYSIALLAATHKKELLSEKEWQAYKDWIKLTQDSNSFKGSADERQTLISNGMDAEESLRQKLDYIQTDDFQPVQNKQDMDAQQKAAMHYSEILASSNAESSKAKTKQQSSYELIGMVSLILFFVILVIVAWLGGIFDLIAYGKQRTKLVDVLRNQELKTAQSARADAEMRLTILAAQVEPHFLFNTLTSVRSAVLSDHRRAVAMLDHLATYLRASIPKIRQDSQRVTVALSQQLEVVEAYLALMHERMPRLQYSITLDEGLENALLPPLMLISLVENAVKHGVEPKLSDAKIEVTARRISDQHTAEIEVCVQDDGVGFSEESSGNGIGLANIQERLSHYYGTAASLTLKSRPEGGVAAYLRLPLNFEE